MQKEIQDILQSVGKVIVGKDETILQAVISMLCGGHVLLEDVPGVGKTQLATSPRAPPPVAATRQTRQEP